MIKKDKIVRIGVGESKKAVSDNATALNELNGYYSKDHYMKELNIEKLVSVVRTYNQ